MDFLLPSTDRNRADDVIDDLIEKVLAAYPPERLERVKGRTEAMWKGMGADSPYHDRVPYVLFSNHWPEEPVIPEDADELQRSTINELKMMLQHAVIDDEFYPAFSSGVDQLTIPSLFKCENDSASASARIKPVIKTPSDVYSLPDAEIREGRACYDMLYRMVYKYRRTGGRIPVYMTDVQGPFSCAAQMWGIQEFLCDLDEYSDEVHHLLSLCTDAIIYYFHAMFDAVDGNLVPIHCPPALWIPKDCGVAVSDDFFAVVGGHTVKEFSMPYLERIGEEFGGITAHSCGNMNHLASIMGSMKNLKALNFSASETNLMKFARECDPRIPLIVHKTELAVGGLPLLTPEEHLRYCADVQRATGVRIFSSPRGTDDPCNEANLKRWEDAARL